MMTRKEAEDKWCPFARVRHTGTSVTVNRDDKGEPEPHCLCITQHCMAWRWETVSNQRTTRGYCGLAGEG